MSEPVIVGELGNLAWIHEFGEQAASQYHHATLNPVSLSEIVELREKSAKFEQQVRSAFQANPRFVDQYFDKSDFAFDSALCDALANSLQQNVSSVADSFSTLASRPILSLDLGSAEPKVLTELVNAYAHITRGLRNLATQVNLRTKQHKNSYLPCFLEAPLELIRQATLAKTEDNRALNIALRGLSTSIFQLATNMSIQNTNHNLELLYAHILPKWICCLSLDDSDQKMYGSLCAFIHTVCLNDPKRIWDFITDEPEFNSFISYCASLHAHTEGGLDENMLHWFHLACKQFWPHLPLVISELERTSPVETPNPTQIFVLHVLDRELDEWVTEHPNTEASEFFGDKAVLSVIECLIDQAERAEEILVRIGRNSHLSPTEPPTPEERPLVDYAWVALQIIGSISMALGSTLKSQPQSIQLVRSLIRMLGRGNGPAPTSEAEIKAAREPAPASATLGVKTLLIRSIANFAFGCKVMQDEIRTAEGIPLLLNGCKGDPFNPSIREWALFACRNVCEQNEENQQLIAGIKASGVMPSVELEEMGFRAVLEETGKVRLEQVDGGQTAQRPSE